VPSGQSQTKPRLDVTTHVPHSWHGLLTHGSSDSETGQPLAPKADSRNRSCAAAV